MTYLGSSWLRRRSWHIWAITSSNRLHRNQPFSHSVIHCFPLECICGGGCLHPGSYLWQWKIPVNEYDDPHAGNKNINSSFPVGEMLRVWLHCPLPCSVSPRPWCSSCPVKHFGPLNTPARVQHSLQDNKGWSWQYVEWFYPVATSWRARERYWALLRARQHTFLF